MTEITAIELIDLLRTFHPNLPVAFHGSQLIPITTATVLPHAWAPLFATTPTEPYRTILALSWTPDVSPDR